MSTCSQQKSTDSGNAILSSREIEVLTKLADGKSAKEVADALFLSRRTVEFHLWRVYAKLGVSNRMQAVLRATELGALQIPEHPALQTSPAGNGPTSDRLMRVNSL